MYRFLHWRVSSAVRALAGTFSPNISWASILCEVASMSVSYFITSIITPVRGSPDASHTHAQRRELIVASYSPQHLDVCIRLGLENQRFVRIALANWFGLFYFGMLYPCTLCYRPRSLVASADRSILPQRSAFLCRALLDPSELRISDGFRSCSWSRMMVCSPLGLQRVSRFCAPSLSFQLRSLPFGRLSSLSAYRPRSAY